MWKQLAKSLERLRERLEDAGESRTDTEALLRVQLAELLAQVSRMLAALANDESER